MKKRKTKRGAGPDAVKKRRAVKRLSSKNEKRPPQARRPQVPYRDESGRFAKRPAKEAAKRPAKKELADRRSKLPPKNAKRPAKKTRKPKKLPSAGLSLNGVRLSGAALATQAVKLGKRTSVAALIALTNVPPSKALVRVNDRIVSAGGSGGGSVVILQPGDVVEVRVRKKGPRKTPRPSKKRPLVKKAVRKTAKERIKAKVLIEASEEATSEESGIKEAGIKEPEEWVAAYGPEWYHLDGTTAVHASHVRLFPEARRWVRDYQLLLQAHGEDSNEIIEFSHMISEYTNRPRQEVFTLFMSP